MAICLLFRKRQQPYSDSDRDLLLRLLLHFDPKRLLFSAQRDANTAEQKNRCC